MGRPSIFHAMRSAMIRKHLVRLYSLGAFETTNFLSIVMLNKISISLGIRCLPTIAEGVFQFMKTKNLVSEYNQNMYTEMMQLYFEWCKTTYCSICCDTEMYFTDQHDAMWRKRVRRANRKTGTPLRITVLERQYVKRIIENTEDMV